MLLLFWFSVQGYLGLLMLQSLWRIFPNFCRNFRILRSIFPTFYLEYPSVLSRLNLSLHSLIIQSYRNEVFSSRFKWPAAISWSGVPVHGLLAGVLLSAIFKQLDLYASSHATVYPTYKQWQITKIKLCLKILTIDNILSFIRIVFLWPCAF